jgi:hypothetical protein
MSISSQNGIDEGVRVRERMDANNVSWKLSQGAQWGGGFHEQNISGYNW